MTFFSREAESCFVTKQSADLETSNCSSIKVFYVCVSATFFFISLTSLTHSEISKRLNVVCCVLSTCNIYSNKSGFCSLSFHRSTQRDRKYVLPHFHGRVNNNGLIVELSCGVLSLFMKTSGPNVKIHFSLKGS